MKKSTEFSPILNVEKETTQTLTAARSETIRRAAIETAARWFVVSAFLAFLAASFGRIFSGKVETWIIWIGWIICSVGCAFLLTRRARKRVPTPFELARRLERRFPRVSGLLTAAVDFEQENLAAGAGSSLNDELRSATIRGAVRTASQIWRELDVDERFSVVWNVAPRRRRMIFDVAFGVVLTSVAVGVSAARVSVYNVVGVANRFPNETRSPVESKRPNSPDWESTTEPSEIDANLSFGERSQKETNESESTDELESIVADLSRLIGVAESFANDLRRRANFERAATSGGAETVLKEDSDVALLQAAREIETLVDAPEKGVVDRLKRLVVSAETELRLESTSERFVALLTAARAREFVDEASVDSTFRSLARLGATSRGTSPSERILTFEETARRQEAFIEKLRREKFAWSILAASRKFGDRRRELQAAATALFETTRAALILAPGRTAFEIELNDGAENGGAYAERAEILARTETVRAVVDNGFADFERLRDRLTNDDAADFLDFVGRVGRENGFLNGADVERSLRETTAIKTEACDEIAANATNGRFGAALEIVEKTKLAVFDVAAPTDLTAAETSDSEDGKKTAATLAAARLTFGNGAAFGSGVDARRSIGAAFVKRNDVENGRGSGTNENVEIVESSVDGTDESEFEFADETEPTSFAELKELSQNIEQSLKNKGLNGKKKGENAAGNSPDSSFEGNGSANDLSSANWDAAPIDPVWNELPDVERERLKESLKTKIPPEFAEKLRLYRLRVFDGRRSIDH